MPRNRDMPGIATIPQRQPGQADGIPGAIGAPARSASADVIAWQVDVGADPVVAASLDSAADRDHRRGGIVRTAHLPAYRRLGCPRRRRVRLNRGNGRETARTFERPGGVRDRSTRRPRCPAPCSTWPSPAIRSRRILEQSAGRRAGPDAEADGARPRRRLAASWTCCQARHLTAAVNLQLRFSPAMLALRAAGRPRRARHADRHRPAPRDRAAVASLDAS